MANGEALAAEAGLPWPRGDAPGLRRTAGRLDAAARAFGDLGTRLGGLRAEQADWRGLTAAGFDTSVEAESAALGDAGEGLDCGGRALRALADAVEDAQDDVARLARRVVEHQDRAAQAGLAVLLAGTQPESVDRARLRATRLDAELDGMRRSAGAAADAACEAVRRADGNCALTLAALTSAAPLAGTVAPTLPATPLAMPVAAALAPDYRFDAEEDHFPMDVRDWLANADARDRDGDPYFDPRGEDVRNGDLDSATLPFAYHVTRDGDLQLEYGTFYAFNDFPSDFGFSDHEGDFEPVTVQVGDGGRPEAVDYEAHGHTGAVPWRYVERRGLHPQVYVAHGGHGNHPASGRYESDFSKGHDFVRNSWEDDAGGDGRRWDSGADIIDARAIPGLRGDERFGEDQGDGNPRPFLHPDQGPAPDLDDPATPGHADHAEQDRIWPPRLPRP